ncbi:MAG: MATE family efflux transporter [Treponema sp.]|jgi:putative MATE family efflux protein|nr:MATE family efflux transporter [Treponema sp.]
MLQSTEKETPKTDASELRTSKFEEMTTAPVEKLVSSLAVPAIVIMMVSSLYNMADTYFVGALGTSATAAVGVSFSLMAVIQAVGFFFGHGAGNYISRALGAQDSSGAEIMASTGFFSALSIGALISVGGSLFMEPLARTLGATETILPYALDYLRFILLGSPFMMGSLMLNNLLRYQGSAFLGMLGMVSGAVLNIGLDPLFIFVFGMGITGAALATMISQTLSCLLLFVISRKGKETIRISPRNFRPRPLLYGEITRGGAPSLLRQGTMSLAVIILNRMAGAYGDAAIAAISIVTRVVMLMNSAILGFGQGFQPVCGFNYGARRYDRVKGAFWFCVRLTTVLLFLAALGSAIFAPRIIALFRRDDPEVIRIGTLALRFQSCVVPLGGWIVLCNMMLQTMGRAVPASFLAFSRQGLFLIPIALVMIPALGILGIQLCTPIAELCTFILALPLGIGALKRYLPT